MMIVRTNRYLPKDDLYRKIDAGLAVKGWNLEDLAREVLKEFGKILVTGKRTPAKLQNTIATTFRKRTGSSKWFPLFEYVLQISLTTSKSIPDLELAVHVARNIRDNLATNDPPNVLGHITRVIDTSRHNDILSPHGHIVHTTRNHGPGGSMLVLESAITLDVPAEILNIPEAYGLVLSGDSMVPAFHAGTTVWVDPNVTATQGLVLFVPLDDSDNRRFFCMLRRITKSHFIAEQLNPPIRNMRFARSEWRADHVKMTVSAAES